LLHRLASNDAVAAHGEGDVGAPGARPGGKYIAQMAGSVLDQMPFENDHDLDIV
jgi:hypothetical protein